MRVNVYAEEMTERIEIREKEIEGQSFTGLRIYLELPATVNGTQYQGPFMHHPGDDDSSAVTFWGKQDLRKVLRKALELLDAHYAKPRHLWTDMGRSGVTYCPHCHVQRRTTEDGAYQHHLPKGVMWQDGDAPACVKGSRS